MSPIPASQARKQYTQAQVAAYREQTTPTGFFTSQFKRVEKSSRNLSIAVRRGGRSIAVDVERGTNGNRNSAGKSTEKIFVPPLYDEFVDITDLTAYDNVWNNDGDVSVAQVAQLVQEVNEQIRELQMKIERSIELQCAQVLLDGVVQLKFGGNIDFKRKAGSLVDHTGNDWTTGTNDPIPNLEAGCNFVKNEGMYEGGVFNVILGSEVANALLNNATFKARADIRNFKMDEITGPIRNAVGGTSIGEITVGANRCRLWVYDGVYDNTSGTVTNYMHAKKFIVLPATTNFHIGFAAAPQLLDLDGGVKPVKGAFLIQNFKDVRKATHEYVVKSAPLAIPTAVDQIYTGQAVS